MIRDLQYTHLCASRRDHDCRWFYAVERMFGATEIQAYLIFCNVSVTEFHFWPAPSIGSGNILLVPLRFSASYLFLNV